MFKIFLSLFCALITSLAFAKPAIINLQIENDTYFTQDKHYTNGLNLSYLPLDQDHAWLTKKLKQLGLPLAEKQLLIEYSINNAIYTPKDIEEEKPQPHDHPWAGHTFLAASLTHLPLNFNDKYNYQQALEINFGIIGPASGSKFLQTEIHRVIDSKSPNGWHNQLQNEPTLSLGYRLQGQKIYTLNNGNFLISQPEVGFSLGSPFTSLNYGWSLGISNVPQPIKMPSLNKPSLANSYFSFSNQLVLQGLIGVQQKLVIYNLFFDGQMFHNSNKLDKKRLTNEAYISLALTYKKMRITSKAVFTGKEFKGQEDSNAYATLGVAFYL